MSRFAATTQVSSEKSRQEIERTLSRYGADQFLYGWRENVAIIGFRAHGRMIRFELALPEKGAKKYLYTEARMRMRSNEEASKAWEQDCRQKWRALALVVKAKLEAVESGITTFEEEFLAHVVLPDGKTFGQWAQPQLEAAYTNKKMPLMLPGAES